MKATYTGSKFTSLILQLELNSTNVAPIIERIYVHSVLMPTIWMVSVIRTTAIQLAPSDAIC